MSDRCRDIIGKIAGSQNDRTCFDIMGWVRIDFVGKRGLEKTPQSMLNYRK